MIEFIRASASDAALIAQTRQKAWQSTYRGIYPDEAIDGFDLYQHTLREGDRLRNPNYRCFLVMDGVSCVGYFAYGTIREGIWKNFIFRLHSLYLLPAYQGKGLGRQVFGQVKKDCQSIADGRMYLDCHPMNIKALGFYRHMGGMITHTRIGHCNPCEDSCRIEFDFTKGEQHG